MVPARGVLCLVLLSAALAGCGARGPLDLEVIEVTPEGGVDASLPADTGVDSTVDSSDASMDSEPDVIADVAEATADAPQPNPIDCGMCVAQQCGMDFLTCFQDPTCRMVLQCVFMQCFGGAGGVDPQCVLTCSNGNFMELAQILKIVACIGTSCGPVCMGLFGDGGIGLGGGGGGGGG